VDPQRVSDGQVLAGKNLLEGLVTPDAAGTGVVPATADRWTVSQDATVYLFHIRGGVKWSDGTPVTAQDFEWTYRRLLSPSTSTQDALNGSSAYLPDLGIKNAVAYQSGTVSKWSDVGVKALDASHLRIALDAPNATFLQEMTAPSMVALPQRNLERFPYSCQRPGHWVGNGAVRDQVVDAEHQDGPGRERTLLGPQARPPEPRRHPPEVGHRSPGETRVRAPSGRHRGVGRPQRIPTRPGTLTRSLASITTRFSS
jgi:Bacterial extracellular solute-binding proteins, family 5 Middle